VISLSTRGILALTEILRASEPVTVSVLARRLRVSPRAVRYDLEAVDAWLRGQGLPPIQRQPGRGLCFAGTPAQRDAALRLLTAITPDLYIARPRERLQILLSLLLHSDRPLSCRALRMRLGISKGTLTRTAGEAAHWLRPDGLILRSSRAGLYVEGAEEDRRRAISRLFGEVFGTEEKLALLSSCRRNLALSPLSGPRTELFRLLDPAELEILERCALDVQDYLGVQFSDASLADLVLDLAVAVQRIRRGACLRPSAPDGAAPPVSRAAGWLAERLQRELGLLLPPAEVAYLDSLLRAVRRQSGGTPLDARELARQIALQAEGALGCPLAQDEELVEALALHLGPAIARLEQRVSAPPDPLVQEVQQQYPLLYQVARWAADLISRQAGVTVTEDEVGYIAMHLGAAMERQRRRQPPPSRVLVVCPSGLATGRLLAARLMAEFPQGVAVQVVPLQRLSASTPEADLLVSTVPLQHESLPSVTVHPLLPPVDVIRVSTALGHKGSAPTAASLLDAIMAAVAEHAILTDPPGLRRELSRLLAPRPFPALSEGGQPMLADLLTQRTVALDVEVSNWEEAIRAAGRLLVADGSATEAYVEAMVQTVRSLGPYIVLVPGVAVAHAQQGGHVRRVGMSLVRLRTPVAFGAGDNDPVDLVFAFGSPDQESHLRALADLARLLGDADAMRRLRTAQDVAEVLSVIGATRGGETAGTGD